MTRRWLGSLLALVLCLLSFMLQVRPAVAQAGVLCLSQDVSSQNVQTGKFRTLPAGARMYFYGIGRYQGTELKMWVPAYGLYWVPIEAIDFCSDTDTTAGVPDTSVTALQAGVWCVVTDTIAQRSTGEVEVIPEGTRVYFYDTRRVGGIDVKMWVPGKGFYWISVDVIGPCDRENPYALVDEM